MSVTGWDLALYAGALFVLFITPGPVWFATIARTLSGGFGAAWPLALGVALGDVIWSLVAILGLAWVVTALETALVVIRWLACLMFVGLGILAIRHADAEIGTDSRLTRPGAWAGFFAGLAVILGNPKAILFYLGLMPGFFPIATLTPQDIVAIAILSALVPLVGNLGFALFVDRMRLLLKSRDALRRLNISAGLLLIAVGLVLPWT